MALLRAELDWNPGHLTSVKPSGLCTLSWEPLMEQGLQGGGGRRPGTHGTAVSEDLQDPFIEGEPGWDSLS